MNQNTKRALKASLLFSSALLLFVNSNDQVHAAETVTEEPTIEASIEVTPFDTQTLSNEASASENNLENNFEDVNFQENASQVVETEESNEVDSDDNSAPDVELEGELHDNSVVQEENQTNHDSLSTAENTPKFENENLEDEVQNSVMASDLSRDSEVSTVTNEPNVVNEPNATTSSTEEPYFNSDGETRTTEAGNIDLAPGETVGSIEETANWRIENGYWHTATGTITNHGDTPSEVSIMGLHHPGPVTLWEGSVIIAPRSTQDISLRELSVDASNASYLAFSNNSDNAITIEHIIFANDGLPTIEEQEALTDAEKAKKLREPESGFRVLPYLQSPSSTAMIVNWVSELDEPGTLTLTYNGQTQTFTSDSEYMEILEYTLQELNQELTFNNGNGVVQSLPQGEWLESDANYKHTVVLTGLDPNTTYNYSVQQGDENYQNAFTTFPEEEWEHLRLIAFSDTETEPKGALENREWVQHPDNPYVEGSEVRPGLDSLWAEKYGTDTRNGTTTVRYPLDQQTALNENLYWIEKADPDALIIAGDLTQGGGYQPAWDEFWRHFSGEFTDIASSTPILTALGNWETTAVINGGYGTAEDRSPVVIARNKYHAYMTTPGDENNPQHKDSYYRTDMGPITLITLDSTNGIPDETVTNPTGDYYTGDDSVLNENIWMIEGRAGDPYITTDTQGSFTAEEYDSAYAELTGGSVEDSDLPNFNPGTEQWNWAVEQLRDAREQGQIILVQFHHAPYSSGVHGTPPNFEHADNQSGVAMRVYTPLFERYGVAAVIAGHDEMFERSFVDTNNDGQGFHVYDVGVAADGLRSEYVVQDAETGEYYDINYNTASEWTATEDEPELWLTNEQGVRHLVDGGLHYGHLQMDIYNTEYGAEMVFTPVYIFPILDDNYEFVRTERRMYGDIITLAFDENGLPISQEEAQIITFEQRLEQLEDQVAQQAEKQTDTEQVLEKLASQLTDLRQEYKVLDQTIVSLNERVQGLHDRLTALQNQITGVNNQAPSQLIPDQEGHGEEQQNEEKVDQSQLPTAEEPILQDVSLTPVSTTEIFSSDLNAEQENILLRSEKVKSEMKEERLPQTGASSSWTLIGGLGLLVSGLAVSKKKKTYLDRDKN